MRLDVYLTVKGYADSRSHAQTLIKDGSVCVDGSVCNKSSAQIPDNFSGEIKVTESRKYVSRAGYKLEAAIEHFGISPNGKTAVDIGSSTGGFTQCLLNYGASRVFCVDSGTNQLSQSLRNDSRVSVMENTNARYIGKRDFDRKIDIVTMDVSFISARLIIPSVADILDDGGEFILLIKPQFEVGREHVGKGGIVRNEDVRTRAVNDVIDTVVSFGFECRGYMVSPIKGGDGNTEYLAGFLKKV